MIRNSVVIVIIILIMLTSSRALAAPNRQDPLLPAGCATAASDTTVVNLSGWDPRTFGVIRLKLHASIDVCNVELAADWGDKEVAQMWHELDEIIDSGDRLVLVGYSMSGPFVAEVLDGWVRMDVQPELLEQLDVVMVAPAAGVSPSLRGFVRRRVERWTHAWNAHFDAGVLARNHVFEWNSLIDRTHIILGGRERVVDNGAFAQSTLDRLGSNVITLDGATHLELRFRNEVSDLVTALLRRVPQRG